VGWLLGLLTGYVLGKVEDHFIEMTLTTVLAYVSYLVAEEVLKVSGVMATIAAGLTIGGWGRMKVSYAVRDYLEHFWEYVAFLANALIFLMVGLRMDLGSLWATLGLLCWVVVAMLVSRAVVVYGLMPFVQRLPRAQPILQEAGSSCKTRNQLFRNSKQFTGLLDCQARTASALDFHFNASLATLNLVRAADLGMQQGQEPHVFSMASWKQCHFNERLLEVFMKKLALAPTWVKNHACYDELRTYGAIAA
jgi:hypothetical protein